MKKMNEMKKNFEFEMMYVGECRGYFFKGCINWEDENLVRGLGRVKIMGGDWEEDEDYIEMGIGEDWGFRKDMSIREVIEWLESDCIGGGEESYVRIKVNGKVVFRNEIGIWEYYNVEDGEWCEDYMEEEEKKWGEEYWEKYEEYNSWNFEELEKMK